MIQNQSHPIRCYFAITVIPLGIVLNMLSIYVFTRKRLLANNVFAFFYAWLCLFDSITLASEMLFAISGHFRADPTLLSNASCKFFFFWRRYINHVPPYLELIVTIFLYVQICQPELKQRFAQNKRKFIALVLLGTFLTDIIYFAYELKPVVTHRNDMSETSNHTIYEYECTTHSLVDFTVDLVNVSIRNIIPFGVIFTLNLISIVHFRRSKQRSHSTNHANDKRSKKFFAAIFAQNIIFLLIYAPWAVCFVLRHVTHSFDAIQWLTDSSTFDIVWQVANSMSFANNMTPFFIHIALNSLFRAELVGIVCSSRT